VSGEVRSVMGNVPHSFFFWVGEKCQFLGIEKGLCGR
jgi:hypothetical protein